MLMRMFFVAIFLLPGCASVEEYRTFAAAGQVYATSTEQFIGVVISTEIDETSTDLARTDGIGNGSGLNRAGYDALTASSAALLMELQLARAHVRTLGTYFKSLAALATSDAPQQIGSSLATTLTNLNGLGTALGSGGQIISDPSVADRIARLVVQSAIHTSLNEELEKNGNAIDLHLEIQQQVLAFLIEKYKSDREAVVTRLEPLLARDPLLEDRKLTATGCGRLAGAAAWVGMANTNCAGVQRCQNRARRAARRVRHTA